MLRAPEHGATQKGDHELEEAGVDGENKSVPPFHAAPPPPLRLNVALPPDLLEDIASG